MNGETVSLPDGRTIQPDQVLGEARPGTRMAHVGDVGRIDELVDAVHGVDTLIIEATYLQEEAEMADQFAHLTALQAAELAAHSDIKYLILTHISRRYRERDVLAEAQAIFPNTFVARDFDAVRPRLPADAKVKLVFARGEGAVWERERAAAGSPYRIWVYRTFRAADSGEWTAKVLGPDGAELGSVKFQVEIAK